MNSRKIPTPSDTLVRGGTTPNGWFGWDFHTALLPDLQYTSTLDQRKFLRNSKTAIDYIIGNRAFYARKNVLQRPDIRHLCVRFERTRWVTDMLIGIFHLPVENATRVTIILEQKKKKMSRLIVLKKVFF